MKNRTYQLPPSLIDDDLTARHFRFYEEAKSWIKRRAVVSTPGFEQVVASDFEE